MTLAIPLLALLAAGEATAKPPARSPTDPAIWIGKVGHRLDSAVFAPIGGRSGPLATPGLPTVVVLFASWCHPCVDELPQVIADAKKLSGRVRFVGIDYADTPEAGDALIERFRVPFPVERFEPPSGPRREHHGKGVVLSTTPPKKLPEVLPMLAQLLPPEAVSNLREVAARCKTMNDADCVAFAKGRGVLLQGAAAPEKPEPPPARAEANAGGFDLPHTFILDARGTLVEELSGYERGKDPILAALKKLGVE